MRKHKNKKKVVEKLTTLPEAASFNIQFWQKQSAQMRFAAMWKAVEELYKLRGISGKKLRLQRSIQHIEYI